MRGILSIMQRYTDSYFLQEKYIFYTLWELQLIMLFIIQNTDNGFFNNFIIVGYIETCSVSQTYITIHATVKWLSLCNNLKARNVQFNLMKDQKQWIFTWKGKTHIFLHCRLKNNLTMKRIASEADRLTINVIKFPFHF